MKKPVDYRYILFDLDGTLTDSYPGISRCVQYALEYYGIKEENRETLRKFCGPPLMDSFQGLYGFDYRKAEEAVARYREEYNVRGLFENDIYEGIPQLLADLRAAGKEILLATSKPEGMAIRVLDHFDLTRFFHTITGAGLSDKVRHSKADVIRETMSRHGITEDQMAEVLMVGDRKYDVEGAKECGLDCLGVYYGYAEGGELEAAGANYVVNTVEELRQALLG